MQCKGQTYKTAEIVLLCHKILCLFCTVTFTSEIMAKRQSELTLQVQDAQLSQRDRAAGCVIVFAKSRRLELGDNILRTL